MATENKRMAQRIDTQDHWNNSRASIQPGEICFIEGSTDYRVNVSDSPKTFENCTTFKGSDNTSTSANDGRTTLYGPTGTSLGTWTANQSANNSFNLPNFVGDAKVGFKDAGNLMKVLANTDWTPQTTVKTLIPNAIPTDLFCCILREFAYLIQTQGGMQGALTMAQTAILSALQMVPDLDR